MILYILRIVMMAQFIKLLIKGVGPLLLIGQRVEVLVIRHGRILKALMQLNHLAVGPLKSFILPLRIPILGEVWRFRNIAGKRLKSS